MAVRLTECENAMKFRTSTEAEQEIEAALIDAGIEYVTENEMMNAAALDFYLPQYDVYIEVKAFHSPRIAEQMGRAQNVIAVQGAKAIETLALFLQGTKVNEETG